MAPPAVLHETRLASFAATEHGIALLEGSAALQDAVARYSATQIRPESNLGGPGYTHIGTGNNSQVWSLEGVAVKASSDTTGRHAWRYGTPTKPEDLIGQFTFLNALNSQLADRTQGTITTPNQYFALRSPSGSYLLAQQFMGGWTSLYGWAKDQGYDAPRMQELFEHTKARILSGIGHSALRPGLVDLGLQRREKLHADNILVPTLAATADTARLCIIDQPSRGIRGRLGILAANLIKI